MTRGNPHGRQKIPQAPAAFRTGNRRGPARRGRAHAVAAGNAGRRTEGGGDGRRGRREDGRRDMRPALPALGMWGAALATCGGGVPWGTAAAGIAAIAAGIATRVAGRRLRSRAVWWPAVLLTFAACLMAVLSAGLVSFDSAGDPLARFAGGGGGEAVIVVRLSTPVKASPMRGEVCAADGRAVWMESGGVREPSHARVRVGGGREACGLRQGGLYRVGGVARAPVYGTALAWVEVGEGGVREVRAPGLARRVCGRMQDAFVALTAGLSPQGRVLVPGLTLGVMGQSTAWDALAGDDAVSAVYASGLSDDFARAGIMHLMAVSGGHFMTLVALVGRACRRRLARPEVVGALSALSCLALGFVMFPSDSVTRALVMVVMGAVCTGMGRPSQALSALCWTVMLAVLADPLLSRSYGFALSVLSVAGIVVFAARWTDALAARLPRRVASALAVTLAAQVLSLPVQVMLGPGVPLMAPLANMLVSPLVGAATLLGLCSLSISWLCPHAGFALAWLASCCTAPMERCARLLGHPRWVLSWPGGARGAAWCAAALAGLAAALILLGKCVRHIRDARRGEAGAPRARRLGETDLFLINAREWAQSTLAALRNARWAP